jgi:DNA-binding FadR family transcriptional regulator
VVSDAAEHITDDALARLRSALRVQASCFDDPVQFLISDREFHVTIYRACGNPLLADLVTDLYTYMMDYRRRVMARSGAINKSYQEHVAIVDALERHDRAATLTAFGHHLDRIYTTTRSILSASANASRKPARGAGGDDA